MKVEPNVQLMKPLFLDNGMYNRLGKRIRAKMVKTIACEDVEYTLWVRERKPENDYPRQSNDTHYLMIQAGDYLVPSGHTEYELELRAGSAYLNKKWYGNFDNRAEYYKELREGRSYQESERLIKDRIAKENEFIKKYGKDGRLQAEYLKTNVVDPRVKCYIEARDNKGRFADFVGAAFLGELDQCDCIASAMKKVREQERVRRQAALDEQRKKDAAAKEAAENQAIQEAENIFLHGGTIEDGGIIIRLAEKYGVDIPLRTKGWVLHSFARCTLTDNSIEISYWKRKKEKGSTRIYGIISSIRTSVKTHHKNEAEK